MLKATLNLRVKRTKTGVSVASRLSKVRGRVKGLPEHIKSFEALSSIVSLGLQRASSSLYRNAIKRVDPIRYADAPTLQGSIFISLRIAGDTQSYTCAIDGSRASSSPPAGGSFMVGEYTLSIFPMFYSSGKTPDIYWYFVEFGAQHFPYIVGYWYPKGIPFGYQRFLPSFRGRPYEVLRPTPSKRFFKYGLGYAKSAFTHIIRNRVAPQASSKLAFALAEGHRRAVDEMYQKLERFRPY